jgi:hypothetical protein
VEVQGSPEADFAERMFVYCDRLFDRYHADVGLTLGGTGSESQSDFSRHHGSPDSQRPFNRDTAAVIDTNQPVSLVMQNLHEQAQQPLTHPQVPGYGSGMA